jgi:ribonuclease VapC
MPSAATLIQSRLDAEGRKGPSAILDVNNLIADGQIEIIPVTLEQAEVATAALRRFGEGRHPAALDFGDCFAYALAKVSSEPLLFKGRDFSRTDVAAAWSTGPTMD